MNTKQLTTGKKAILIGISALWILNVVWLIYALAYAAPESAYRKNGFLIGLCLFLITSLARSCFRAFTR